MIIDFTSVTLEVEFEWRNSKLENEESGTAESVAPCARRRAGLASFGRPAAAAAGVTSTWNFRSLSRDANLNLSVRVMLVLRHCRAVVTPGQSLPGRKESCSASATARKAIVKARPSPESNLKITVSFCMP